MVPMNMFALDRRRISNDEIEQKIKFSSHIEPS